MTPNTAPCVICGTLTTASGQASGRLCSSCVAELERRVAASTSGVSKDAWDRERPQKFDHSLARMLHAEGWPYEHMRRAFGVSTQAVKRVCEPEVAVQMAERTKQFFKSGVCSRCGGPCSYNPYQVGRVWSGYCADCSRVVKRERNLSERTDERGHILCSTCGEHKPPTDFAKVGLDRKRQTYRCRTCSTTARTEYRRQHREQDRAQSREYKRRKRQVTNTNGSGPKTSHNRVITILEREVARLEALRDEHRRKAADIENEIAGLHQASDMIERQGTVHQS